MPDEADAFIACAVLMVLDLVLIGAFVRGVWALFR